MSWWNHAACRNHNDPELFSPLSETGASLLQIAEAKAVCAGCPVRVECLADAYEYGDRWTIRGGMTAGERRAWRETGRPAAPAQPRVA